MQIPQASSCTGIDTCGMRLATGMSRSAHTLSSPAREAAHRAATTPTSGPEKAATAPSKHLPGAARRAPQVAATARQAWDGAQDRVATHGMQGPRAWDVWQPHLSNAYTRDRSASGTTCGIAHHLGLSLGTGD
jgi:hypothetical protein